MSKAKVFLGTVIGAVAGFAAGVLSAPKSGKQTRQEIKNATTKSKEAVIAEAEHAKDVAAQKAQEVTTKGKEVVAEVADKAEELKDRVERAVEGAKAGFNKKPTTKKK